MVVLSPKTKVHPIITGTSENYLYHPSHLTLRSIDVGSVKLEINSLWILNDFFNLICVNPPGFLGVIS